MDISFVHAGAGLTTGSISFDATGADLLIVMYQTDNETGPGGTRFGLNFGIQAMTLINYSDEIGTQAGSIRIYMYYLLNPIAGAQNLSWTGGADGNWVASAYSMAKQSSPEASAIGSSDPMVELDLTLAPVTDNSWVIMGVRYENTFSAGPGYTSRADNGSSSPTHLNIGDSDGGVDATPYTLGGTGDNVVVRNIGIAVSFAPSFISGIFFPML